MAGDITTTGKMEPQGDLTYEDLLDIYKEQIESLAEAGVDLLVAETMLGVDETMAALDAAAAVCDLPMMCSLTLEADGTALFGGSAVEAVVTLQEMGACAVGLNCSVGPDQLSAVVAEMKRVARVPVIAKPNAGMPVHHRDADRRCTAWTPSASPPPCWNWWTPGPVSSAGAAAPRRPTSGCSGRSWTGGGR